MTLAAGTKLGVYEILSPLGVGGMGEVYRARDTKLQRDVALKILPETMARDAQRMARFEREAQVLASLNHPNIAAIYGLEESNGIRALVMELVEGETLAERIGRPDASVAPGFSPAQSQNAGLKAGSTTGERRSPMSPGEALPIAKQIAEALEYAHERGVIHRDLKPANVKITPEGTVKVLDFGLAKVLDTQDSTATMDMANSPTLSAMATQAGMILGTAAYMSPEQAKGQRVDRRADIWAFGCVLFEMLTGQKPFEGETISDVLAAVIRAEPEWTATPDTTPPSIQRLIRRCLVKDARQRLRDIGEARITIEETISGTGISPVEVHGQDAHATLGAPVSPLRRALPWAVAAAAMLAATLLFLLRPSQSGPPLRKFELSAGKLAASFGGYPEISPDGKAIAYVSGKDLFVRKLDQLEPIKLYTLKVNNPIFWSPDSGSIAFADQKKLWQISTAGGPPREICSLPGPIISGAWGAGGTIFFSAWRGDLYRISAQGGDAKALGLQDQKTEVDFHDLTFLPGGRDLMYVVHLVGGHSRIEVLTGGKPKTVFNQSGWGAWSATYSPTGHLVFMRAAGNNVPSIWAVPFSLSDLKLTGQPFLVSGKGLFPSVSADGTLLYVMPAPPGDGQMAWVNRSGKIEGTIGGPQKGLEGPALSPDGKRIAATAQSADGSEENIWIYDVATGVRTPLLSSSSKDAGELVGGPAWTPDGKSILFTTVQDVRPAIELAASDGSGKVQQLLQGGLAHVSPQGNYIAYTLQNEDGSFRACYAGFSKGKLQEPAAKALCLPRTSANDGDPRISPDGHYAAFVSENAGQPNVYVTQFPGGNGRWQVSTHGGTFPVWSPRGGELFYLAGNQLMSVKVTTQPSLSLGAPARLFSLTGEHLAGSGGGPFSGSGFDVSANGQRFLMVQQVGEKPQPSMVVDQNWFAEFSNKNGN